MSERKGLVCDASADWPHSHPPQKSLGTRLTADLIDWHKLSQGLFVNQLQAVDVLDRQQ